MTGASGISSQSVSRTIGAAGRVEFAEDIPLSASGMSRAATYFLALVCRSGNCKQVSCGAVNHYPPPTILRSTYLRNKVDFRGGGIFVPQCL